MSAKCIGFCCPNEPTGGTKWCDDHRGWITFEELPMGARFRFAGKSEKHKTNIKIGDTMYTDPWGSYCPFTAIRCPRAVQEVKP